MNRFHNQSKVLRASSLLLNSLLRQQSSLRALAVKMSTNNAPEALPPSAVTPNGVHKPRYVDVRRNSLHLDMPRAFYRAWRFLNREINANWNPRSR